DTVQWEGEKGFVTRTLDRTRAWAVQTPQGFRRRILEEAHRRARWTGFVGTDEASLVIRTGRRVRIVEASAPNPKITTPDDMILAARLLK
ncbi:MAG TPA: 2-C-methyl-D-erythritol 4-phosphate cytidylyltransferase, partial [Bacteroidota bacterium]